MKIGLDAGHGLKTAGKQTPNGIKEWTLNDYVRDRVIEYLKPYDVEIICTDNNEGSVDEPLKQRRATYLNANVNAFVSIHHNAYTGNWNKATGVEVFVDKNNTKQDYTLAECIYKNLPNYTGLKGRGIKKENWLVINQNKVPAVLVEGGFMDSTIDYPVITSEKGQDGYARAVAEGLIDFLGLVKGSGEQINTQKERTKSWQMTMNRVYNCGLAVDGSYGPLSQAEANKHQLYKKAFVGLRIRNDYVRWLQNRLKELGYNIVVDGSFWKDTDKIVRQFQKDRGLKVDGYVGKNTVRELLK